MDSNDELLCHQIMLNSKMVLGSIEQKGLLSNVRRIKDLNPLMSITEIVLAQLDDIRVSRGIGADTIGALRGELSTLEKRSIELTRNIISNEAEAELKGIMKRIDQIRSKLEG